MGNCFNSCLEKSGYSEFWKTFPKKKLNRKKTNKRTNKLNKQTNKKINKEINKEINKNILTNIKTNEKLKIQSVKSQNILKDFIVINKTENQNSILI